MYHRDISELPVDVQAKLDAQREASRRQFEESCKRYEAEKKAREAEEKRQRLAKEAHEKKLMDERLQMAREQAEADKQREYKRYIAAGGSPDDFEADYPEIRRLLIAKRIAEQENRVANIRDYMHGLGGGHSESLKPMTPPSQG